MIRTEFSGILEYIRAADAHPMLLDDSLSHETIRTIELSTRDQASSAMWNHQRKGRVTSSLLRKEFTLQNWAKRFGGSNLWQEFFKCCHYWGKKSRSCSKQQFLSYLLRSTYKWDALPVWSSCT
ncbi:hypothetical protein TNCT_624011 [Trichonephila clavata]|uniref:Uncharacterized protein n=1 Tax=Trichonephila clavata TaxID=2740835 RepID=A0A8X6M2E7_TRICU|nr:hypothetical protein TNCT_624011 [Trichonephila clavata]